MSSEDIPGLSAELIECIQVVVEEALDRRGDRGRDGPVDGTAGSSSSVRPRSLLERWQVSGAGLHGRIFFLLFLN